MFYEIEAGKISHTLNRGALKCPIASTIGHFLCAAEGGSKSTNLVENLRN
jgi:hypothetical protein